MGTSLVDKRFFGRKNISNYSMSFAGCGFLCVYHTGVCAALKEYAPQLLENKLCGASAGSLVATAVACGICLSRATSILLNVAGQARSFILGALNTDFDLMKVMQKDLELVLPENAHELCSGRVRISLTRVDDLKNVIISEFHSKEDLIQAIVCSCFIPVYAGFYYPEFRGETYIDGGVTDNQPYFGENTLTVSPFSGEADICPRDDESASMMNLNFSGTSIRFTANNLQRFMFCLFPPSPEVCAQICRQGFTDAIRFLIRNGLSPKAKSIVVEAEYTYKNQVPYPKNGLRTTMSKSQMRLASIATTSAKSNIDGSGSKVANLFPKILENTFSRSKKVNSLADYLYISKFIDYANKIILPVTTSLEVFRFSKSLSLWVTSQVVNHWFVKKIGQLIRYLMDITLQQLTGSFIIDFSNTSLDKCTQLLRVREMEFDENAQETSYLDEVYDVLDKERERELEILKNFDPLVNEYKFIRKSSSDIPENHEDDTHDSAVAFSGARDAALAFYYTQNNKMHTCEILSEGGSAHKCHSHIINFQKPSTSAQSIDHKKCVFE